MLALYRQDQKGNWVPVSNFNVRRNERLKVELHSGVDWLSNVTFSLTGIDLNPIQRNLGTDRIVAPGYNRKASKEFVAPSTNGTYMVTASWKDQQGWPISRLVDKQKSITINVTDQASKVTSIAKPSIGDSIQTGLKTSAFIIWGVLAIIVAREFRK